MVNIVLENNINLDLRSTLLAAYASFNGVKLQLDADSAVNELMDFILQRMKGILLERGISYDVVEAVFMVESPDLTEVLARINSVNSFKSADYRDDFMVVYNRAHNLSRKWETEAVDAGVLADESEKILYNKVEALRPAVPQAISQRDYSLACQILAGLRPPLDNFFTAVMVMVEDEGLKAARLGLLKCIANLCHQVADFSRIVI